MANEPYREEFTPAVSARKRNPAIEVAAWVGLAIALLSLVEKMGWAQLSPEQLVSWESVVTLSIPIIVSLAGAWFFTKPKVTPMIDPRDDDHVPLLRVDGKPIKRQAKQ